MRASPTWRSRQWLTRNDQSRSPGWYPAGATPNEQVHWDGQRWTARRRWVHSAWLDVPMEAAPARPRPEQPTSSTEGHRWSTTSVVLLVVALAGLGGVIFALVSGVNSAPAPEVDVRDHRDDVEAGAHVDAHVGHHPAGLAGAGRRLRGGRQGRRDRPGRLPGAEGRLSLAAGALERRHLRRQLLPADVGRRRWSVPANSATLRRPTSSSTTRRATCGSRRRGATTRTTGARTSMPTPTSARPPSGRDIRTKPLRFVGLIARCGTSSRRPAA